ncbi:hypothetical protein [Rubellimicrobium arenae]|uniref:hypothetical protein n=1 Tax=Rubellimicrobium arenae TaxID=2817372 RepID=UPI001B3165E4|nr:hypothetical protein [Rubellimicrobium arenae]
MTDQDHQRVIRFIAENRFPFPGQTDWPVGYVTLVNGDRQLHSIEGTDGPHWPDIVILNEKGQPCRFGEVETDLSEAAVTRWAACAAAADTMNETGVKNLFVYVPRGMAAGALELLDRNGISFAGLREYAVEDERVVITPVLTRGDRYDHQ